MPSAFIDRQASTMLWRFFFEAGDNIARSMSSGERARGLLGRRGGTRQAAAFTLEVPTALAMAAARAFAFLKRLD